MIKNNLAYDPTERVDTLNEWSFAFTAPGYRSRNGRLTAYVDQDSQWYTIMEQFAMFLEGYGYVGVRNALVEGGILEG